MNNYKIIAVDKDGYNPPADLEREVNNFLSHNIGFFANTPPVIIDEHLIQMLITVDIFDEV